MGSENIVARRSAKGSRSDAEEGDVRLAPAPRGPGPVVRPEPLGPAPDGRSHLNGRVVCGVTAPRRREAEADRRPGPCPGSPDRPRVEALIDEPDDAARNDGGAGPGDGPGDLGGRQARGRAAEGGGPRQRPRVGHPGGGPEERDEHPQGGPRHAGRGRLPRGGHRPGGEGPHRPRRGGRGPDQEGREVRGLREHDAAEVDPARRTCCRASARSPRGPSRSSASSRKTASPTSSPESGPVGHRHTERRRGR